MIALTKKYKGIFFKDIEEMIEYSIKTINTFINDYKNFRDRYIYAKLPCLICQ